jgi:ATP-dependent Clp protease, protease subunit
MSFKDTRLPTLQAHVRLSGSIDERMLQDFHAQRAAAPEHGPLVFELTTTGGDADVGRRLALEVRLLRQEEGREVYFLGKSTVYSAGVTFMAAFLATHRFLTADCVLLVHERRMDKQLALSGALRACAALVRDAMAEIENGQELERDGFDELVAGSSISFEELMRHVEDANWYLRAAEAHRLGLVAGVI